MHALRRPSLWAAGFGALLVVLLGFAVFAATPAGADAACTDPYDLHKESNECRADPSGLGEGNPTCPNNGQLKSTGGLFGTAYCVSEEARNNNQGGGNGGGNNNDAQCPTNFTYDEKTKKCTTPVGSDGKCPSGSEKNGNKCVADPITEDESEVKCTADSSLSWILCPILELAVKGSEQLANIIEGFLEVSPLQSSGKNNLVYDVWQNLRNIANVLFIFVMFAVIYSQATSTGISAYGVKKILPKLVAAAILANLSFFLCAILVDAFNVLGAGLSGLLDSALSVPINGEAHDKEGVLWFLSGLEQIAVAAGVIVIGLVFFWSSILIALVVVLLTLAARQALIIILVLLSPIAFALWVLPNTEQYFKKWFEYFFSALLMYPLVMVVFAGSRVAAQVLANENTEGTGEELLQKTIAIFVAVIPLIALPLLFKVGGYSLGKINQMAKNTAVGRGMMGAQQAGAQGIKSGVKEAALRKRGEYLRQYEPEGQKGFKGKFRQARGRVLSGRLIPTQHSKGVIRKIGEERLGSDIDSQGEFFDTYKNNKEKLAEMVRSGKLNAYQRHAHIKRLNEMGASDMLSDLMYGKAKTDANGNIVKDAEGNAVMEIPAITSDRTAGKSLGAQNRAILARHIASNTGIKDKNHQLFFQAVGMERAMSQGEGSESKIMEMGRDLAIKKGADDMSMQMYASQSHEGQSAVNANLTHLRKELEGGRERINTIDGSSNLKSLEKLSATVESAAKGAAANERIAPNLSDRQRTRMGELDTELARIGELAQNMRARGETVKEGTGDLNSDIAGTVTRTRERIAERGNQ